MASIMLKTNRVDLILLDIEMPEMSGFEYLKQLRETPQYRDIPVIFVTSHATRDFLVQAMSSGAKDFVVKPILPDILKEKIHGILGGVSAKVFSRGLMEQMLGDLSRICKKGMEAKAGALIREIRNKHFNPITSVRIAEICELIATAQYKTALEKIKALDGDDFFEEYEEYTERNNIPGLTPPQDEGLYSRGIL
jgi:CheY-like chemotaxis protein